MDIPEGVPPNSQVWNHHLPNNIIIVNYNIMMDILYYYHVLSCHNIHYYSPIKIKINYKRRI